MNYTREKIWRIMSAINYELSSTELLNINHLILRMVAIQKNGVDDSLAKAITCEKVCRILSEYSNTYEQIEDDKFNFNTMAVFVDNYVYKMTNYYFDMIDKYNSFENKIIYSTKDYNELKDYTLDLLNEAIRIYIEIYNYRDIIMNIDGVMPRRFKIVNLDLPNILGFEDMDYYRLCSALEININELMDIDRIKKFNSNYKRDVEHIMENMTEENIRLFNNIRKKCMLFLNFNPLEYLSTIFESSCDNTTYLVSNNKVNSYMYLKCSESVYDVYDGCLCYNIKSINNELDNELDKYKPLVASKVKFNQTSESQYVYTRDFTIYERNKYIEDLKRDFPNLVGDIKYLYKK